MTLYLDTSSAIKLYVSEAGSDVVHALVDDAAIVATSAIAYAETRAGLARLRRDRALSAEIHFGEARLRAAVAELHDA